MICSIHAVNTKSWVFSDLYFGLDTISQYSAFTFLLLPLQLSSNMKKYIYEIHIYFLKYCRMKKKHPFEHYCIFFFNILMDRNVLKLGKPLITL